MVAAPDSVAQAPLPLAWPPRFGADDFCVSDSNRAALLWLADPGAWPSPHCLLIGPAGAGKSHLARMFARRHAATIIEDADRRDDGEPLFHAWNAATPAMPLLLTARLPPRGWVHGLPDLASRLGATATAVLHEPDDALLAAVLAKQFSDRGLIAAPEVLAWLVARIERRFAAVADVVARLDSEALGQRRDLTVPFCRQIIGEQDSLWQDSLW